MRKKKVERCVREVMEGGRSMEYRQTTTNWKEKAKRAMSEGGSTNNNILKFIGKLELKSSK